MKTTQTLVCIVAVLLVGLYLGNASSGQTIPNAVPTPRYQISAWAYAGNPSRPSPEHGCYILDTLTGSLWHCPEGGKPLKVSDKLP